MNKKLECAFTVSNDLEPKKTQKKFNEIVSAIASEVLGKPKPENRKMRDSKTG